MHFQRLRLSGFKSFVDPTEFRIEPGLTGIVGPNGCGKSNLLEALRWVMGANSAKALRAGGMDDVIFAGSGARASRNHAEVQLTIDNAERRAPPAFNDHPVLEVIRRIDRGAGSTYRINGREVRARDVQLLFADASTGSNSPALVRQGQISELIGAKPQNRRMILEEAAGVSGLHSRRHEAELRLKAAEANLARLDDVAQELESLLGRLKREARQAERYKKLSAEIRALQGAVLYARWNEARESAERLALEAQAAVRAVEETARAAGRATQRAADAEAALKPLREAETVSAAILHKLAIDKERLDREAEAYAAELSRLEGEIARIDADRAREAHIVEDADAALKRLVED
ncbi:MAG TPA: AAA family ATPase, partial [Phenylobacterium sp.]|uniref:AAA family ATPase n=1 Tax=Phenylobacterium sp. TaxID=1871053 RepID=UPI002B492CD0